MSNKKSRIPLYSRNVKQDFLNICRIVVWLMLETLLKNRKENVIRVNLDCIGSQTGRFMRDYAPEASL